MPIFSEVVEVPENVEILERPNEIVKGAFEYSEPYTDGMHYFPRQINGVYEDTLDSRETAEIVEALNVWHMQEANCSCAVVCSEMELNRQTDAQITEAELCKEGEENGWYDPESGTAPDNINKYAEIHGLESEVHYGEFSLADIRTLKENGTGVIVAVDNLLLACPSLPKPCDVNHVVEIVGFDYSDAENPLVIINDPGTSYGRGAAYELNIFAQAAGANYDGDSLNLVTTVRR